MLDMSRPYGTLFQWGAFKISTNIQPLTGLSRRDKMLVESKLRSLKSPVRDDIFQRLQSFLLNFAGQQ